MKSRRKKVEDIILKEDKLVEFIRTELTNAAPSTRKRIFEKFALAALGSIPWVGGFISAAVSLKTEEADIRSNGLQQKWLEEHQKKILWLAQTLSEITDRFEKLGEQIDERLQSEEYLDIVRKAFRVWDKADTDEKRKCVANIVAHSSGTRLCSDDVVRLFIDWLDYYHESHFAVIREIYNKPETTRYAIWSAIRGECPRDDSAEADLFRLLIRDLSTGGVIRQGRDTTSDGRFLRKAPARRGKHAASTMKSAFEDTEPYVLTELGKQFVHYTMTEIVPRIEANE